MDALDEYTRRKRRDILFNPNTYDRAFQQMFRYTPPPPTPPPLHEVQDELARLHAQYAQEAAAELSRLQNSIKYEVPDTPPLYHSQMTDGTFYGLSDFFALRNTQQNALNAARREESNARRFGSFSTEQPARRDEVGVGRNIRQRAGINFRGTISDLNGSINVPVPMTLAAAAA